MLASLVKSYSKIVRLGPPRFSDKINSEQRYERRTVGIYNTHLLEYLDKLHLPICRAAGRLESSLQIKQAAGRPVAWPAAR